MYVCVCVCMCVCVCVWWGEAHEADRTGLNRTGFVSESEMKTPYLTNFKAFINYFPEEYKHSK